MSDQLLTTDAILSGLRESGHPIAPTGYPCVQTPGAVMQRVNESKLSADFVIVTGGPKAKPNRNGTTLLITPDGDFNGMDTAAFERTNPVVLFGHGLEFPLPVASARDPDSGSVALTKEPKRILSTAFFNDRFAESEMIFAMIAEGMLNAASVQFMPAKAVLMDGKEPTKADRESGVISFGRTTHFHFVESELWEWSVVSIPADAGAVRKAVERQSVNGVRITPRLRPFLQSIAEPGRQFGCGWNDVNESERQHITDDDDVVDPVAVSQLEALVAGQQQLAQSIRHLVGTE